MSANRSKLSLLANKNGFISSLLLLFGRYYILYVFFGVWALWFVRVCDFLLSQIWFKTGYAVNYPILLYLLIIRFLSCMIETRTNNLCQTFSPLTWRTVNDSTEKSSSQSSILANGPPICFKVAFNFLRFSCKLFVQPNSKSSELFPPIKNSKTWGDLLLCLDVVCSKLWSSRCQNRWLCVKSLLWFG